MMLLEMAASGHGDRVAISCGGNSLTCAELYAAAGRNALRVSEGNASRVAFLDVSGPAFPIALFSAAWAGIPFAPLNYRLTGGELDRLLAAVAPCFLVTDEARASAISERPELDAISARAFFAAGQSGPQRETPWNMDSEEIAVLLFTSGTTGPPKAAVLRHKHLVSYILSTVEFGVAEASDAALVSVPPYHVAGVASILSSIYAGRRIVQLPNFSAEAWLALAQKERITHAFVVPTMLARIVERLEEAAACDLSPLRSLSYGGGKMPQSVIERAMERLPHTDFTNAYGLTETSSTLSLLSPDDHRNAFANSDPAVRRRLASVGRPIPGIEIEIRDEAGRPLAAGERGEITVRGEQVSGEYLGHDRRTGEQGWFPTRDGGFLDEDGYLFVDGRIDDIIVRGGENLSPGEIEDVLLAHAAVADCAVVGLPDEQWGEAVAAVIVLREHGDASPELLQDWVREHLRSSRTPERIEFRRELPYNETGKLLRRQVRALLRGETE